jgi:mono/diheme cytochrome c family protein
MIALFGLGVAILTAQDARRTVWDGVFTAAQAERGKTAYADHCIQCHKEDLSAYDSVLMGDRFMQHWREDSVASFFITMKNTMPRGAPASLPDAAYVDITAYVLQANDFPAGAKELSADALENIRVEGKSGPAEVHAGALVDVVGCLTGSGKDWTLTNATAAIRTRNPNDSTAEELKAWDAKPLGTRKFGLMDADFYHPEAHRDHKVEVKGFLIKNPGEDKINVTALQMTANCGQ